MTWSKEEFERRKQERRSQKKHLKKVVQRTCFTEHGTIKPGLEELVIEIDRYFKLHTYIKGRKSVEERHHSHD